MQRLPAGWDRLYGTTRSSAMSSSSSTAPITGATIEIRRLGVDDAEAYRRIRLAALANAPRSFGAVHAVEAARPVRDFAERLASAIVLGAWVGAELVGTADFRRETGPKEAHKAVVRGVYVAPHWRRHGVSTHLLRALIAAAREEVEQLLLTVVQDNAGAIALYERFGFVVYGVEPKARKEADGYSDKVLMVLRLDT